MTQVQATILSGRAWLKALGSSFLQLLLLSQGVAIPFGQPSFAGPAPLPRLEWNGSEARLVQAGADYGRIARLANGSLGCVYDVRGKVWIRHSTDGGHSWLDPVLVAEEDGCWLTNAELLLLRDGTLLYFWNERPLKAVRHQGRHASPGVLTQPFRIRMARSSDHGKTWSAPGTLHTAGNTFEDGCWEPAGLELPSGELHVYFANESPFRATAEQEIALVRSPDRGRTWSHAERVAFRKNHRDGMPSPLLLAEGKGIVIAIEDNQEGGRFKPSICRTSLTDNWRSGPVTEKSTNRWLALAKPLPADWYAGAPCLRQLPSGATLLSFQESPDGTLDRCRMAVCVGDSEARNFSNKSYPLPLGPKRNQAWNSLFVKDPYTVIAVLTATVNDIRGIWIVEGKVVQE